MVCGIFRYIVVFADIFTDMRGFFANQLVILFFYGNIRGAWAELSHETLKGGHYDTGKQTNDSTINSTFWGESPSESHGETDRETRTCENKAD